MTRWLGSHVASRASTLPSTPIRRSNSWAGATDSPFICSRSLTRSTAKDVARSEVVKALRSAAQPGRARLVAWLRRRPA